jgi:hypothetical protein
MNAWNLSSSGLTRGSSLLKTWMPDQVGHDELSVIPAQAGIHACKTWMPDQVGHDSFEKVGHDSFEEVGHDSLWGSA